MSAQSDLNAITGTVIGSVGSVLSIGKGIDSEMAKRAKETMKQKLAIRKQINNQVSNRMNRTGGDK